MCVYLCIHIYMATSKWNMSMVSKRRRLFSPPSSPTYRSGFGVKGEGCRV